MGFLPLNHVSPVYAVTSDREGIQAQKGIYLVGAHSIARIAGEP